MNSFEATSESIDQVFVDSLNLEIPPPLLSLPANFPDSATPRYKDGSRLRWLPACEGVDWGIAIGRFYAYAPHLCRWSWKYIILLDSNSPSAAWVRADTAWEQDLEPLPLEQY